MSDLLVGFGLVMVFEGLLWAAAPQMGLKLLVMAAQTPEQKLRVAGVVSLFVGCLLVWLIRG